MPRKDRHIHRYSGQHVRTHCSEERLGGKELHRHWSWCGGLRLQRTSGWVTHIHVHIHVHVHSDADADLIMNVIRRDIDNNANVDNNVYINFNINFCARNVTCRIPFWCASDKLLGETVDQLESPVPVLIPIPLSVCIPTPIPAPVLIPLSVSFIHSTLLKYDSHNFICFL